MEKIIEKLNKLLKKAIKANESPVAAIIVYEGKIIAKAYNKRNKSNITTDHAEIIAITKANRKLRNWRTNKCTMYVSLEPCEMCKSVIRESRIDKVYYFLPRNPEKKQYKGTNFINVDNSIEDVNNFNEKYKKIMKKFWENKR